jgi:hypothetical protein
MSTNQPPAVDPTAREMIAAVREFVQELMRDVFRMGMQGGENATNAYAHACMENLPKHRLPALVAAHDTLAAALNAASPDALPILSLTTEEPA